MKPRFKIGDKVKVIRTIIGTELSIGTLCEVREIIPAVHSLEPYYAVRTLSPYRGFGGYAFDSDFE